MLDPQVQLEVIRMAERWREAFTPRAPGTDEIAKRASRFKDAYSLIVEAITEPAEKSSQG